MCSFYTQYLNCSTKAIDPQGNNVHLSDQVMKAPCASVKPSELKFMSENDLEPFLKLLLRGQIFHVGNTKLFFYEIEWQSLITVV
jgi:hypothetical protein